MLGSQAAKAERIAGVFFRGTSQYAARRRDHGGHPAGSSTGPSGCGLFLAVREGGTPESLAGSDQSRAFDAVLPARRFTTSAC